MRFSFVRPAQHPPSRTGTPVSTATSGSKTTMTKALPHVQPDSSVPVESGHQLMTLQNALRWVFSRQSRARSAWRQRGTPTFQLQHLRDRAVVPGDQEGKGELNVGQPDVMHSLGAKETVSHRPIHTHTPGSRDTPPGPNVTDASSLKPRVTSLWKQRVFPLLFPFNFLQYFSFSFRLCLNKKVQEFPSWHSG